MDLKMLHTISVAVLSGVAVRFTMNSMLNRTDVIRKDFEVRNRFMVLLHS